MFPFNVKCLCFWDISETTVLLWGMSEPLTDNNTDELFIVPSNIYLLVYIVLYSKTDNRTYQHFCSLIKGDITKTHSHLMPCYSYAKICCNDKYYNNFCLKVFAISDLSASVFRILLLGKSYPLKVHKDTKGNFKTVLL